MRRLRLALCALGALVALGVLATFASMAWCTYSAHAARTPDWLGNSPDNVARLTQKVDPNNFVFYVVGDSRQMSQTFEALLRLIAPEQPDFVVHLGDFVQRPHFACHRLFIQEMAEEHFSFPVFLIPGNHEVDHEGPVRTDDFRRLYGPACFHFFLGRNLFLFLDYWEGTDQRGTVNLDYAEQVLAQSAARAERIFLFCHAPPAGLTPLITKRGVRESERFLELVRRYRVSHVLVGHHHGYWKGERDGTTWIVSGGGGAQLEKGRGAFHHAVRVAVENGKVTDTTVVVKRHYEPMEVAERMLLFEVWPRMTGSAGPLALTALTLLAAIAGLACSARCGWRLHRQEGAR
jgi:3',5'-cyclic AMP phosphodiesterase CpdA